MFLSVNRWRVLIFLFPYSGNSVGNNWSITLLDLLGSCTVCWWYQRCHIGKVAVLLTCLCIAMFSAEAWRSRLYKQRLSHAALSNHICSVCWYAQNCDLFCYPVQCIIQKYPPLPSNISHSNLLSFFTVCILQYPLHSSIFFILQHCLWLLILYLYTIYCSDSGQRA